MDILQLSTFCATDKDKGCNNGDDLKRDRVQVNWDIRGEDSRSALIAVEEGRGDLQHIHKSSSIEETNTAAIWKYQKRGTVLIGVGGRNIIRRNEQSLNTNIKQAGVIQQRDQDSPGSKMDLTVQSLYKESRHCSSHLNK